jgi:hypothetical protein
MEDERLSIPEVARALVWCRVCGRKMKVAPAECLSKGYPECCGATVSLYSPEERARRRERREQEA